MMIRERNYGHGIHRHHHIRELLETFLRENTYKKRASGGVSFAEDSQALNR